MMCRKALRVRARDLHIEPALRVFVNVGYRRGAFRRFAAGVGILMSTILWSDVLEALEAAAAIFTRWFFFLWQWRWRELWRRGRWRWRRRGRINVNSPRGEFLRFFPRQGFDNLVYRCRLLFVLGRRLYVVA